MRRLQKALCIFIAAAMVFSLAMVDVSVVEADAVLPAGWTADSGTWNGDFDSGLTVDGAGRFFKTGAITEDDAFRIDAVIDPQSYSGDKRAVVRLTGPNWENVLEAYIGYNNESDPAVYITVREGDGSTGWSGESVINGDWTRAGTDNFKVSIIKESDADDLKVEFTNVEDTSKKYVYTTSTLTADTIALSSNIMFESLGAGLKFSGITIENGVVLPEPEYMPGGWDFTEESGWVRTENPEILTINNNTATVAGTVYSGLIPGAFAVSYDVKFNSFYNDDRLGTIRTFLTDANGDELLFLDMMAQNDGQVYISAQWRNPNTEGWYDPYVMKDWGAGGSMGNEYKVSMSRADQSNDIVLSILTNTGTPIASYTVTNLGSRYLNAYRNLGIGVQQAQVQYSNINIEDVTDSNLGGKWEAADSGNWAATTDGILFIKPLEGQDSGIINMVDLFQNDTWTIKATIKPEGAGGAGTVGVDLLDDAGSKAGSIKLDAGAGGTTVKVYDGSDNEIAVSPQITLDGVMSATAFDIEITKLQDKDYLLVYAGVNGGAAGKGGASAGMTGLSEVRKVGLSATETTEFTNLDIYDNPEITPIDIEGGADFEKTGGVTVTNTNGVITITTNTGASETSTYLAEMLEGDWSASANLTIHSTANSDGRGVARLILKNSGKEDLGIFTFEAIGNQHTLSFEMNDGSSWTRPWATDYWVSRRDTSYNVTVSKQSGNNLKVDILGNEGFKASFNVSNVATIGSLRYAGTATYGTAATIGNLFIKSTTVDYAEIIAGGEAAYNHLLTDYWRTDRIVPTNHGYESGAVTNKGQTISIPSSMEAGSVWERSIMLAAMDTWYEAAAGPDKAGISQKIASDAAVWVDYFDGDGSDAQNLLIKPGIAPLTYSMDDCGWVLTSLLLGYMHSTLQGNAALAEKCLDYAKKLFNNSYALYYDEELGGGMWYRLDPDDRLRQTAADAGGAGYRDTKSLYAVAFAIGGLDIADALPDEAEKAAFTQKATNLYNAIEGQLGRPDGLYWADISYKGPLGKERPNDINEAGSVSYLAGNMAMAVLHARHGNADKALKTAEGIAAKETEEGIYLNDRDAWTDTYFLGMWQREVLPLSGISEKHSDLLTATAQSILENSIVDGTYYSAAWAGPNEATRDGYGSIAEDNNAWGKQDNGSYYGSTPLQIMTSATTAHMVIAAGANAKANSAGSDSSRLKSLAVDGKDIWPVFIPAVQSYRVIGSLTASSVSISFSADENAVVKVNNEVAAASPVIVPLNGGTQDIPIEVTGADGLRSNTYTLTVVKQTESHGTVGTGNSAGTTAGTVIDGVEVKTTTNKDGEPVLEVPASAFTGGQGAPADTMSAFGPSAVITTSSPVLNLLFKAEELINAAKSLLVKTGSGSVILTSATLQQLAKSYKGIGNISLRIGSGSLIVDIYADGAVQNWYDPKNPVILSIPYQLKAGQSTSRLYAYEVKGTEKIPIGAVRYVNGNVLFQVTGSGRYDVGYNEGAYSDVKPTDWFASVMDYAYANGLFEGKDGKPAAQITRAEFTKLLVMTLGIRPGGTDNFTDVGKDSGFAPYIAAAKELGIVDGVGNNKFAPEAILTRQEMFHMANNVFERLYGIKFPVDGTRFEKFTDKGKVFPFAVDTFKKLTTVGLVNGTTATTLDPLAKTERAQAVTFLRNFINGRLSDAPAEIFAVSANDWTFEGDFKSAAGADGAVKLSIDAAVDNYYAWNDKYKLGQDYFIETAMTFESAKIDHGVGRIAFKNADNQLLALVTLDYLFEGGLKVEGQLLYNNQWSMFSQLDPEYVPCKDKSFTVRVGRYTGDTRFFIEVTGDKGFHYIADCAELGQQIMNSAAYAGVGTYGTKITFDKITFGTLGANPGTTVNQPEETGTVDQTPAAKGSLKADEWGVAPGISVKDGTMSVNAKGTVESWNNAIKLGKDFDLTVVFKIIKGNSEGIATVRPGFTDSAGELSMLSSVKADAGGNMLFESQYNGGSWVNVVTPEWAAVKGSTYTLNIKRVAGGLTYTVTTDGGSEKTYESIALTEAELDRIVNFGFQFIDTTADVYEVTAK